MKNSRWSTLIALFLGLTFLAAACSETEATGPRVNKSGTRELHHRHDGFPHYIGHFKAEVISSLPHETSAETNGLEWVQGSLYESSGLTGESTLSRISPESGDVTNRIELADDDVGAGLTHYNGKLYQLTRGSNEVLVYDAETMALGESLPFDGEGWGLCNSNDKFFVTSNGTSQLTIRNIETFSVEGSFAVELAGRELPGLDELECIGDQVWATITDPGDPKRASTIVVIKVDTTIDTKEVEATVDISEIIPDGFEDDANRTLSGIALRQEDKSLWLTGRQWPATYEVRLVPIELG